MSEKNEKKLRRVFNKAWQKHYSMIIAMPFRERWMIAWDIILKREVRFRT